VAGEDGVETVEKFRDRGVLQVEAVAETELYVEFRRELDVGEAAALAYAVEADADLVLFDEREARQAARRHDVPITGAIGVLLRSAGDEGVDVREELDALREAGFWISDDLYREALDRLDSGE
jgi:predicted nucleic acid-binding protein